MSIRTTLRSARVATTAENPSISPQAVSLRRQGDRRTARSCRQSHRSDPRISPGERAALARLPATGVEPHAPTGGTSTGTRRQMC
jgi:hypothetical protein